MNAQATNIGDHEYAKTAGYFTEFPEDIKMIGVSFNTQMQKTGTALQGEVTYRHGVPLQFDDVELLYAALTPFESGIATALHQPVTPPGNCQPTSATPVTGCNQLGAFQPGPDDRGWERHDTWQGQFTATQVFANVLKASQLVLVFEGAVDYIPGLEDKYDGGPVGRGLRYNGPGTYVSGNPELASYPQFPKLYEPRFGVPDPHLVWLRRRRAPGIPEPDRCLEHPAALLLGAGRARHFARSRRQFRRGPARAHARRRCQPARQVGA